MARHWGAGPKRPPGMAQHGPGATQHSTAQRSGGWSTAQRAQHAQRTLSPMSSAKRWEASAASSTVSLRSVRVAGLSVVCHSCSGIISPKPWGHRVGGVGGVGGARVCNAGCKKDGKKNRKAPSRAGPGGEGERGEGRDRVCRAGYEKDEEGNSLIQTGGEGAA